MPGHHDAIRLLDSVAGMREPVGQFAVVGQQDQPFAVQVEPSDREEPHVVAGHHVDNSRPAGRVAIGRNHAVRLVDGVVDELWAGQFDTIEANLLPLGIDFGTQLGDHLRVDLDSPGPDQLLALSTTTRPGRGQHLFAAAGRHCHRRPGGGRVGRGDSRRSFVVLLLTLWPRPTFKRAIGGDYRGRVQSINHIRTRNACTLLSRLPERSGRDHPGGPEAIHPNAAGKCSSTRLALIGCFGYHSPPLLR